MQKAGNKTFTNQKEEPTKINLALPWIWTD
jgi:hypothetical protein